LCYESASNPDHKYKYGYTQLVTSYFASCNYGITGNLVVLDLKEKETRPMVEQFENHVFVLDLLLAF